MMRTTRSLILAVVLGTGIGLLGCGGGGGEGGGNAPLACGPDYLTPNYVLANDPGDGEQNLILTWPSFPVSVRFASSETATYGSNTYDTNDIFWEAAQRWVDASGGEATLVQTSGSAQITVNVNRLSAAPGSGGTLGVTSISYYPSTKQIVSASITINTWPGMTQAQFAQGLKHTTTHEFGHALFLQGHSDQSSDVMYYTGPTNTDFPLTSRDINSFLTAYCGDFGGSALTARGTPGEQPITVVIECNH